MWRRSGGEAARRDHGVDFATGSLDALLERPDIDLVGIYTPDHLHRDQVVRALEAGKHVLVTKPMTVSNEESDAVIEAARSAKKRVMPAQTQRYVRPHMALRRFIDTGEFGDIYFVASDYYQDLRPIYDKTPWRYEAPQDFIYGGLSHNIDIMRYLKGEIAEVAAFGSYSGHDSRYPDDVYETFVVNAKFEDGTLGRIALSPRRQAAAARHVYPGLRNERIVRERPTRPGQARRHARCRLRLRTRTIYRRGDQAPERFRRFDNLRRRSAAQRRE